MDRENRGIKARKANLEGDGHNAAARRNSGKRTPSESRSSDRRPTRGEGYKSSKRDDRSNRGRGRKNKVNDMPKANTKMHKNIGVFLTIVLLVSMLAFIWAMLELNMLPADLLIILVAVLAILWVGMFALQVLPKKRATFGKVLCVLLSMCLGTTSFYIYQTNNMLSNITNNSGLKIDEMAVVVRSDDAAETLEDVKDYTFGVQYVINGADVKETEAHINETLGATIKTKTYNNVGEQAKGLIDGDIDALIYNEAYSSIIEDEIPEYNNLVKIIYTYEIETVVEEKVTTVDVTQEPFSVYISGIDVYGSIGKSSRSDVNIIMYINPATRQILLVNTPRDYYVSFPGVTGGAKDKLTHAGVYGVETSVNTLSQLYDSEIDYYARVNFTSLITMIDALGGVEVYSDQAFTTMHGGYRINVGMNKLSGAQALGFSRERYSLKNGDNDRGKNQQAVITAMIQKAASPAIITGASKIMASVSGNVDTDMPQEDIQALIKSQLSDGGSWNIKSMAATGTGDSQYCYSYSGSRLYVMQPNLGSVNKIKDVIQALENGEVLTDAMVAQ